MPSILSLPQVSGPHDFEWVKNGRYYWDADIDDCVVRMSNSHYIYGYEYLGASPRLVITPLTVRTYVCACTYTYVLYVCINMYITSVKCMRWGKESKMCRIGS